MRVRALVLVLFILADSTASAQRFKGVVMLPRDLEVELALSALPPHLRGDATVHVLDPTRGFVVEREGANGYHALVVRTDHAAFRGDWTYDAFPVDLLAPISFDAEGARTILPAMLDVHSMQASGMAPAELKRTMTARFATGHYTAPGRAGFAYMLSPILRAHPDPAASPFLGTFSYPHYMIHAPGVTSEDIVAGPSGVHGSITEPGAHGFLILPAGREETEAIRVAYGPLLDRLCDLHDAWCVDVTPWPTDRWARTEPGVVGLDQGPLQSFAAAVRNGTFGQVDRLVVVRGGYLAVDEHFVQDYYAVSTGAESAIGCGWQTCDGDRDRIEDPFNYLHPSSHPYWHGTRLHSVQSVSKSVAATVVGTAIHRGAIRGVDVPLLSFFADRDLTGVDPRLHDATLEDLLTMRSGIEWHEDDRPPDETNTTIQLEQSDDWIAFTLSQPMDAAPGTKWVYNSGGSHLMSGIVRSATGRFLDAYAEETLFGPLGIRSYHWKKDPTGYPDTEGGLYIEATDLAKIGLLYLRDGVWDGSRLLPEDWVRAATEIHVADVDGSAGYGYQWWREDRDGVEVWAGLGFGNNYLIVLPDRDVIGVVQSWNLFGNARADVFEGAVTALIEASR